MNTAKIIQFMFAILAGGVACGSEIECPADTKAAGETVAEISEAWCELFTEETVLMHGPYRAWYSNGVLGTKGQYDKGAPIGKWYGWYESGAKQGEIIYKDGMIVSETYWDRDSNEASLSQCGVPDYDIDYFDNEANESLDLELLAYKECLLNIIDMAFGDERRIMEAKVALQQIDEDLRENVPEEIQKTWLSNQESQALK